MAKSTLTREWLQHQISAIEVVGITDSNTLAAFKLALAAMDSEPVGEFYEDGPLNWYQISDGDRVPAHRRIPLYRHAQPAPVVPDAYVRDERGRMMLNGVCEPKIGFGAGWNACRAAMHQAGNSPTQNQGWIPVSERVPDEGDHVLVSDGVGMEVSWIREREWKKLRHIYSEDVTHWMPLPAGPKETNK